MKIAVVVLDALRKDAFDEAFDYVRGRRFENAWSTSHWTVPAHASLFTGVYPSEHGSTAKHIELSYEGPTLAEQLRKHGISTRGISANGNLSPINKYDRGFETYVTESGQPRRDVVNWPKFINENEDEGVRRYLSALRTSVSSEYDTLQSLKYAFQIKFDTRPEPGEKLHAEGMMETISEMNFDQNSFLFMNLMDAHQLFEPPRSYQSCEYHDMDITDQLSALALQDEAPPKADDFVTGYGDSVNYLSDIFSDIYRYLVDEFDYVIMLSDHGDALGEQGVWGHIPSLQSEITRVPLVITGVEEGEINRPVSIKDIPATVTDLFDIDPFPHGKSLLSGDSSDTTLTEAHGLQQYQRDKLKDNDISSENLNEIDKTVRGIASGDGYGFESVHDGWVGADSNGSLQKLLEEKLEEINSRDVDEQEISGVARERLEKMGYI